jgi:hypothetical protein
MKPAIWMLCVTLALSLCACGKVGSLDRPAPLYGERAKAQYRAEQRAAAAKAKSDREEGQPEALPGDKSSDPYANPAPARSVPIEGTNPNPSGSALPGVLPDPYANPQ